MAHLLAKIADDDDYLKLKNMVQQHDDWSLEYDKNNVKVWTKSVPESSFNMVKVWSTFISVNSIDLYNVLQDPEYRKEWDSHMIVGTDIGHLNPNNDISYYAMSCPPPLRSRDFVLQRSWLDTGLEHYIINHSVCHKEYPPKKGFVRAISYFTGYFIKQKPPAKGCEISYVTNCDPQGILPSWLVNKCTQIFAPRYIKQLETAALGYNCWKCNHSPNYKPWIYPEQITSPKISLLDCVPCESELKINPQLHILTQIALDGKPPMGNFKPNQSSSRIEILRRTSSKCLSLKKREEETKPSSSSSETCQEPLPVSDSLDHEGILG